MATPLVRAPFGGYPPVPTGIADATGQASIIAMLDQLMALMPVIVGGVDSNESSAASPDFMEITRHYKEKLDAEIVGIKASINAMATA